MDNSIGKTDAFSINVLNDPCGHNTMWTRVNVGEAFPGTLTPLNADFQRKSHRTAAGDLFYRFGLQAERDEQIFNGVRLNAFICGKAVVNVDTLRKHMDRMPGTSGDQFEESILGSVRNGVASEIDRRRYPIALVKILGLVKGLPKENAALGAKTETWWRTCLPTLENASMKDAWNTLMEARERYVEIGCHAGLVASFSPAILNQIGAPLEAMGEKDALLDVASGYGNIKETEMLDRLWLVAKGEVDQADFLADYGYMCANGGALEARSWREEPAALTPILNANRSATEEKRPIVRQRRIMSRASTRQTELLAKANFANRQKLKMGFWLAKRLLPIREIGKACMFQATDIARAAARRIGDLLVAEGAIDNREDVFFLSLDMLECAVHGDHAEVRQMVTDHKSLHATYESIELPDFFSSEELPQLVEEQLAKSNGSTSEADTGAQIIQGSAASTGIIEGRARVILDPTQISDFQEGDVLICRVTDPGWSALFSVAGALVADIGGMLSHSAIIARELGIPAVVGTRKGTKTIPNGARVRVDGALGTVEVLKQAPAAEHSAVPQQITGAAASAGLVTGRARIILDPTQTDDFKDGDILICRVTDPGWSALFSIAGALVADIGGMLSHSAIIARELGIPAVVGTRKGTKLIPDGALITVDGAAGTIDIHPQPAG